MFAGHGTGAIFPIAIERAHVADERSDAGDRGNEQMVSAATAQIQQEAALGDFAAE